jgi:hypothetical protein
MVPWLGRGFSLDTSLSPDEVALALAPYLRPDGPWPRLRGSVSPEGFQLELIELEGRAGAIAGCRVRALASGSRVRVQVRAGLRRAWDATVGAGLALLIAAFALAASAIVPGSFFALLFLAFIAGPDFLFDLLDRFARLGVRSEASSFERLFRQICPAPATTKPAGPFRSSGRG